MPNRTWFSPCLLTHRVWLNSTPTVETPISLPSGQYTHDPRATARLAPVRHTFAPIHTKDSGFIHTAGLPPAPIKMVPTTSQVYVLNATKSINKRLTCEPVHTSFRNQKHQFANELSDHGTIVPRLETPFSNCRLLGRAAGSSRFEVRLSADHVSGLSRKACPVPTRPCRRVS